MAALMAEMTVYWKVDLSVEQKIHKLVQLLVAQKVAVKVGMRALKSVDSRADQ